MKTPYNIEDIGVRTVISTQPTQQAIKLKIALSESGIPFFSYPLIYTKTVKPNKTIQTALQNLNNFNLVIFTSKNGVISFFKLFSFYNKPFPSNIETAVIGKGTAEALKKHGIIPTYINPGETSADFLTYLKKFVIQPNKKILLVQGNLAPENLNESLSKASNVQRINVYETILSQNIDTRLLSKIKNNNYGLLVFSSPSAFINFKNHFLKLINQPEKPIRIISIGRTTTKYIKENYSYPVEIFTAPEPGTEGLKNEIINYFKKLEP